MKVSINIATHKARKSVLPNALATLHNQTVQPDVIRVYCNDYQPDLSLEDKFELLELYHSDKDYTDRAKFLWAHEGGIYFSADDDLTYPENYIEKTLQYLDQHEGIITYHGRKLKGLGRNYYKGHDTHHFRFQVGEDTRVDVAGTGVMAFYTDDFTPNVLQYEHDKMVDLLIGLEAAKQNVDIWCCKYKCNWIENVNTDTAIYREFLHECEVQNELADEILRIKGKDKNSNRC